MNNNHTKSIAQACISAGDALRLLGEIANLAHNGSFVEEELDMARQAISDVSVCLVNVTRLIAKRRQRQYEARERNAKKSSTSVANSTRNEKPEKMTSRGKRKLSKVTNSRKQMKASLEVQESNPPSINFNKEDPRQETSTRKIDFGDISEEHGRLVQNSDVPTKEIDFIDLTEDSSEEIAVDGPQSFAANDPINIGPSTMVTPANRCPALSSQTNNTIRLAEQEPKPNEVCLLPAQQQFTSPYLVMGGQIIRLLPGQIVRLLSRPIATAPPRAPIPTTPSLESRPPASHLPILRPLMIPIRLDRPSTSQAPAKE